MKATVGSATLVATVCDPRETGSTKFGSTPGGGGAAGTLVGSMVGSMMGVSDAHRSWCVWQWPEGNRGAGSRPC